MANCGKKTNAYPLPVAPGGCGSERPAPAQPHVPHDVFPIPEADGIRGTLALLKGADALLSSIDAQLKVLTDSVDGLPALIVSIEGKTELIETINTTVGSLTELVTLLGSATSAALAALAGAVEDVQEQADGLQEQLDAIGEIDPDTVDSTWEAAG